MEILSEDEIALLHTKALSILEKTGIKVFHQRMLSILSDCGFKVDTSKQIVFFPPGLTDSYVRKIPTRFTMGARSFNYNLDVKEGLMHTRPMSGCHKVIDMDTGECRHGTVKDVTEIIRLMDALEQVDFAAGLLYPWDCPLELSDVLLLRISLENTSKHFQCQPFNGKNFGTMIDMLLAVAGSKEGLKKYPLLTATIAPTSPLQYMEHEVDIMILAGEHGIPIMVGSTPIAGATGPVSLAGQLIIMHAEILAGIVMSQAANAGAPLIYGPRPNTMDMRTGNACWGSVEFAITSAACQQLARYAGCPVTDVSGPGTESMTWDEQTGIEKATNSLLVALAGTTIFSGLGYLETINTASFEQLVIDSEILGIVRRVMRGIKVDEETTAVEVINRVAHGGNFLTDDHTIKFFKSEHYFPFILNRKVRQTWENEGSKKLHEVAREKIRVLLATHHVEPLSTHVINELDHICEKVGVIKHLRR